MRHQLGQRAVFRIHRDADRAAHRDVAAADLAALREAGEQPARHVGGFGLAGVAVEQHQELVAADMSRNVAGPRQRHHPFADDAQHRVAAGEAERFVDRLEAVEVDEQQREPPLVPIGALHEPREMLLELLAVRQPGQRVARRGVVLRRARLARRFGTRKKAQRDEAGDEAERHRREGEGGHSKLIGIFGSP